MTDTDWAAWHDSETLRIKAEHCVLLAEASARREYEDWCEYWDEERKLGCISLVQLNALWCTAQQAHLKYMRAVAATEAIINFKAMRKTAP